MEQILRLFFLVIVSTLTLNAQVPINLSGTIVNQADFAVKNMFVILVGQGLSDTTNTDGEFEIIGEVTPIANRYVINKPGLEFRNGKFMLHVSEGNVPVSFDIYNLKGAVVASVMKNERLAKGEHTISLKTTCNLSSSVLIGVVKCGTNTHNFRLINAGNGQFFIREFQNNRTNSSQYLQATRTSIGLDSLRFVREVVIKEQVQIVQEYSFAIDKWVDEFEVILDIIPYRAVDFGVKEFKAGRIWPDEVGTTLTEYPRAIKNYLNKTGPGPHDYEWWCSEYYSYALRVGECPLKSSSSNPNWMIDGNTLLRSWYRNNSEYIYKNSIGNFKPLPGDFCHIEGHAAMVWYITDDDSLYTVEANGDLNGDGTFDNQMALVNRGNYKNFKDLLGYGRRTGFVGSSHKSISLE